MRFFILLGMLIIGSSTAIAAETQTYTSPTEGFEISYPSNWRVVEQNGTNPSLSPDIRVILFAPPESGHNDNVNVVVHHGNDPPPLDVLRQFVIKGVSDRLDSFKLVEQTVLQLNGHEAFSIVYSGRITQGPVKQKQYCFYSGTALYALTYTAAPDTFDRNLPLAEEIMRSIRIKK